MRRSMKAILSSSSSSPATVADGISRRIQREIQGLTKEAGKDDASCGDV